jgi:hypothetical protein
VSEVVVVVVVVAVVVVVEEAHKPICFGLLVRCAVS